MDASRKNELFARVLDYLSETSPSRADLYDTLSNVIGMTDAEILEESFDSLAEFMEGGDLRINAFVRYESNVVVISLPRSVDDLYTKLSSIGYPLCKPLMIGHTDKGDVKLMSDNKVSYRFTKLFDSQCSLLEVNDTLCKVLNAPVEIQPTLISRITDGCYTSYKDLLYDIELLRKSNGEYETDFYFPLYGELYDTYCGCYDTVSDRYLRDYKSEIEELLEKEQESDDMTQYFYDNDSKSAHEKIVSIKWDVTEFTPGEYNNKLRSCTIFGVVQIRHSAPFTDDEKSSIKDWIEGQNADGFGEGIEQKKIDTEDGALYVHLWESYDSYFIYDEAQMKEYIKYGGLLT